MTVKNAAITAITRVLCRIFPQRELARQPESIVIIKPCCLGDVVLATPTIVALSQRFPNAQIDFAVGSWSRAVLENNPRLHRLLDSGRVGQGNFGPVDVWRLAKILRWEKYDLAVTLDRSPAVGIIPWLAGIPHRAGLDSFGRGFAHTIRVPVPAEPRHEAQLYLDCVRVLNLAQDDGDCWSEFHLAPADLAALPPLPDKPLAIIHPVGGVNPGMTMLDKRWPAARYAALIERLHRRGLAVAITGTGDDVPLAKEISAKLADAQPRILAGELSLGEFGALCGQAEIFIGGDTGGTHLAVAAGCKTVAIFGPSDPHRYGAFAPLNQAQTVWCPIDLPEGGVGQGAVTFSWEQGASVDDVWTACLYLLGEE